MNYLNGDRRSFLKFLGRSSALILAASCSTGSVFKSNNGKKLVSLSASTKDELELADGFQYKVLMSWGDIINQTGEKFGYNNDFLAFIPIDQSNQNEGFLWVNHEYVHPLFVSGHVTDDNFFRKTIEQAREEMKAVGGSILHIKKINENWELIKNSKYNRRLDAFTMIPFANNTKIFNSNVAMGTLANCAGGITPWGTFLSCEENFQNFYGDVIFEKEGNRIKQNAKWIMGWDIHFNNPPEHYGWVVEIEPRTGVAKKLVSLG